MREVLSPAARSVIAVILLAPVATASAAPQTPPAAQTPPAVQTPQPVLTPPATSAQPSEQPAGPVRRVSIDEAVQLGLENNLDLRVQRIEPQIEDTNVAQARSAWTPNFETDITWNDADSPPDSLLAGSNETLKSDRFLGTMGVSQQLPWLGSSFTTSWDAARATSNNAFSSFNPRLSSGFNLVFNQPLLRNLVIDSPRQQLLVSRNNREISDVDLRAVVVFTVRNVKSAFWDLAYTNANLQAQQQSLDLARQTLKDNRTRVEVGTMAPIDIVEAEAEVARNEEAVIVAQAAIGEAEDVLRTLILDPNSPDFWQTTIEPAYDATSFVPVPADAEAAVKIALDKRTDLQSARTQLDTTNLNVRFFRNQVLPQVNFQANFFGDGLGGEQVLREPGFPPGPIIGTVNRPFGDVVADAFGFRYPTWTVGFLVSYPIGTSSADANLARARLQVNQGRLQIQNIELRIVREVRDLARQVNTNIKRIDATRAARVLAERRLEAEQKKFAVGMSTSFLVFQAQRDLTTARNNELQALVDYAKSRVDFEAVQETSLSGAGISLSGGGSFLATPQGSQIGTTLNQLQNQQQ
jgi:outer membrane protein TolC